MAQEETELTAARLALQGDHQAALDALCASLTARGHRYAQVLCLKSDAPPACLAASGPAPAPPWIRRELDQNRTLRSALRAGRPHSTRDYATWPLFIRGQVAGALMVGRGPQEPLEVPTAELLLLSTILSARARELERCRALRQARAQVRQLEAAEKHLIKRLALARHDLKAPLVPVKGYQDMMLRGMGGTLTPTQKRYVERSKEAVDRLRDLIDYRLRNPAVPVVDLAQQLTEAAAHARRPIEVSVPEEPCWAVARPAALRSALSTWIRALSHTAGQEGTLRVELERGAEGWVLTPAGDPYATLPVPAVRQCAALFAECGGRLTVGPTGVRAELAFDPRVEVVAPAAAQAGPSPRPSSPAASPHAAAADPG